MARMIRAARRPTCRTHLEAGMCSPAALLLQKRPRLPHHGAWTGCVCRVPGGCAGFPLLKAMLS